MIWVQDGTDSEGTAFHGFLGVNSITSRNHFHEGMTLIFIDDTGLNLAMATKDRSKLGLRTPISKRVSHLAQGG